MSANYRKNFLGKKKQKQKSQDNETLFKNIAIVISEHQHINSSDRAKYICLLFKPWYQHVFSSHYSPYTSCTSWENLIKPSRRFIHGHLFYSHNLYI